ncbi:DUF2378 family protein [candidate division WOR-3 bacterium]|uniref:DUF2378 family protein n=1 Tax=candidate division WOR-3 bacterium TaxID=2052148 RepID=A0A9D5K971_UNCW3|nr:DUF2378 family protein [candidate division WOR-3 bacterium]MBD3364652.1 DUF2378 family protein [candidate division WOR-3 bacterium]
MSQNLKVRGLLFNILSDWYRDKYDCEVGEKFNKVLGPDTLGLLESAEKGSWYPAEHLMTVLKTCCQGREQKLKAAANLADYGRYLCEVSLTTSFRGLIVFIDPMTLMKRMPLFWRRYFSGVELKAERVSESNAVLILADELGEDLIPRMFAGWLNHALEMIGAEDINVAQGNRNWDVSWEWSSD